MCPSCLSNNIKDHGNGYCRCNACNCIFFKSGKSHEDGSLWLKTNWKTGIQIDNRILRIGDLYKLTDKVDDGRLVEVRYAKNIGCVVFKFIYDINGNRIDDMEECSAKYKVYPVYKDRGLAYTYIGNSIDNPELLKSNIRK